MVVVWVSWLLLPLCAFALPVCVFSLILGPFCVLPRACVFLILAPSAWPLVLWLSFPQLFSSESLGLFPPHRTDRLALLNSDRVSDLHPLFSFSAWVARQGLIQQDRVMGC